MAQWIQIAVSLFLVYHIALGLGKFAAIYRKKGDTNPIVNFFINFFELHPIFLGLILWFIVLWILIGAGWVLPPIGY